MRALTLKLTLLSVLFVTACSSGPTFRSDFDKTADFGTYKTFAYAETFGADGDRTYESLITRYFRTSIEKEMLARGYVFQEENPDVRVNFHVTIKDKQKLYTTPARATYYPYYGYRGYSTYGAYTYDTYAEEYTEGTLNIDIVDAEKRQLVWEGIAVGEISNAAYNDLERAVTRVVKEIFEMYPFKAGQGSK